MDVSMVGLRVLREVAERGSFTASAQALGYTQSAVSRQVAALEQALGVRLFDRHPTGVRLTDAGHTLLRHAVVALAAIDAANAEITGITRETGLVRLGFFAAAGAIIVPRALAALQRREPEMQVTTRESSTPSLVRALRAGTIDAAVLASQPPHRSPDTDDPPLHVESLLETRLALAVPANGRFGRRDSVTADEIAGEPWIASSASVDEPLLGIWPGLPGRPHVRHVVHDWMAKLHMVGAGVGITTVPLSLASVLPAGVRLVEIEDVSPELRRMTWVCNAGPVAPSARALANALREQAAQLSV